MGVRATTYGLLANVLTIAMFASACPAHAFADSGKVLVVVSSANEIPLREGTLHPTGIFLGEIAEPTEALVKAGYELVFVSPGGKAPTIDPESERLLYWKGSTARRNHARDFYQSLLRAGLSSPQPLEVAANDAVFLSQFVGVFVPGGHAPMVDLYHENYLKSDAINQNMGRLLEYFHDHNLTTALICHGPVALAAAPDVDGKWIYAGYKMTVLSRQTEWINEDFPPMRVIQGHLKEYPTDILRSRGARLSINPVITLPHVVEDRELITGQDPFSAQLMAKRLLKKLQAAKVH